MSGQFKASRFGAVAYFVNREPLVFTEVDDQCLVPLRRAYYNCYPSVTDWKCFSDYMCQMIPGWVGEDLGPGGGFEVYICNPRVLEPISQATATKMLQAKQAEREAALAQAAHEAMTSGMIQGLNVESNVT